MSSLPVLQLSSRCAVWDGCSALAAAIDVCLLPSLCSASFRLSSKPVSFVSRLAYCLLELDAAYELIVPAAGRSPASFPSNGSLHASQQFLTYVELPSATECGSATEFVQWRRRTCELRARGWGYCHSAPAEPATWRIDRLNAIAREQSRKNFTPVTATRSSSESDTRGASDIAQLRARLLKDTESKGVQLLLANAPPELTWLPSPSNSEPSALASADGTDSCVALVRSLCLLFGALRRGGDFAFLLTLAEQLLSSPLVLSVLQLLTGCFSLVALQQCAVTVGLYGSGEVWLVGKGFIGGHATEESEQLRVACSKWLTEVVDEQAAALPLSTHLLQLEDNATAAIQPAGLLLEKVQAVENWSAHSLSHTAAAVSCHRRLSLTLPPLLSSARVPASVLSRALHESACLCLTAVPLDCASGNVTVSSYRPPSRGRSQCVALLASWGMQFAA